MMPLKPRRLAQPWWAVLAVALAVGLVGCPGQLGGSPHLRLGNPSRANTSDRANLLVVRPQYALSFNCQTRLPNWAAWQLNATWLGPTQRQDDFQADTSLPAHCPSAQPNDYRGSGYDRGHLVPSADRTANPADNAATFLTSNLLPQSPANNRGVWRELEEYCRELVRQGKTLYIVAGGAGQSGTIARGQIPVPAETWKVVLVLPAADSRVTEATQTIALRVPNDRRQQASLQNAQWQQFRTSIDEIEKLTGYDFFAEVPMGVQAAIERRI